MKIVFNGKDCGFGNNGGSHTIVQSAKYLARLGAEVTLFGLYKYTWDELPDGVKVVPHGKIPTCDVIVATGQSTVPSTMSHKRCTKRYWWVRGHEVWSASEGQLAKYYRNIPCIVNSNWLRELIRFKTGKDSPVVYQGVDFDLWSNTKAWAEREVEVGGLYSNRHKTKNHYILENLEKKGFKVKMLNRDIKNPSFKELNEWYNNIKVWLSPSVLEGFHNPPVEAAMCGCPLVANDYWKSGTGDYVRHNYNSLVYNNEKEEKILPSIINQYLNQVELAVRHNNRLQNSIVNVVGSREENMKNMLEIFSK